MRHEPASYKDSTASYRQYRSQATRPAGGLVGTQEVIDFLDLGRDGPALVRPFLPEHADLAPQVREVAEEWMKTYNEYRPHDAVGKNSPAKWLIRSIPTTQAGLLRKVFLQHDVQSYLMHRNQVGDSNK